MSDEASNIETLIQEEASSFGVCRICYGSSEDEILLAPCRCLGSVQYIHQSCLTTWLKSGAVKCELCLVPYQFQKNLLPYEQRIAPNITSWQLAWIVKELFVLDWFHFLETVFICISLMIINRMSSFDLVYQFALIGLIELFYYGLNIFSCFFLLYYESWVRLNMVIHVLNYNDTATSKDIGFLVKCLEKYAGLLRRNKRLKTVVDQIGEEQW